MSEYTTGFEKFIEQLQSNKKFYSLVKGKKISDKEYKNVIKVCDRFQMKMMKSYHDLYAVFFWKKFEIKFVFFIFLFLLKRFFYGIFSCFEILIGSV